MQNKYFRTWVRQIENEAGEGTLAYYDIKANDEAHARWIAARTLPNDCKIEFVEELENFEEEDELRCEDEAARELDETSAQAQDIERNR